MESGVADGEDDFDLSLHVEQVEEWEETTHAANALAERDRDYFDNKQLTSEEIQTLKDRGQPDVVFNVIRSKINYLLGLEITSRTDPKALPRTPQDEEASEAATDALRFVEETTDLDQKFSAVWDNIIVEGYGGIELTVDAETGEIDAVHWPWDRLFYDPHSSKHDFSDATYLGGITWMDAEQAKAQWPEAADKIDQTQSGDLNTTHDDKPRWKIWATGSRRKRVKIVQMYYRKGADWYWCHFTKGGKLDGGPVAFRDDKGLSFCPLFMASAYVDRDNNRYGEVRTMISPQDEVNKRRSKSLHLLTQRQTKSEKGAVDDVELMKQEMAKPDGHIEINPGYQFEVIDTSQQIQGNMEMMAQAIQHMQSQGPNAALMGKQNGDPSGRAILANQQGGQTEMSPLIDRHIQLKQRVFRSIWSLIRQYKKAEWWVRVTDNEDNVKFVGLNRPVTMREDAMKRFEEQGVPVEQAQAVLAQAEADPYQAQALNQVVRMENVPAEMGMDITIEQVPDVANMLDEQFQALTKLAPSVVFPPEVYIKASNLRNKRELLEELKKAQGGNPEVAALQAQRAQLEIEEFKAKIEKLRAETIATLAKADQTDAQTGSIVKPQIVEPGQAAPQQAMPPMSPQQTSFQ